MATNSLKTDVSYLQVYKSCLNADQRRNGDLTIPVNVILLKLICRDVLTKPEYQMVDHEKTDAGKIVKLFLDVMPPKGEHGFKELVDVLFENKFDELAKELMQEKDKYFASDKGSSQSFELIEAQTHLRRLIKKNVDLMAKYWSDVIPVAQTKSAFVQVQISVQFKAANINPVNSYREVFDKGENEIHPRILIQADPGCGKTTYINKLALDWANEDEYLREQFDFIFLIPLQTLTMDVLDAIKCFLPKQSQTFFSSYADSAESKILLILDGFDELFESSQWYSSVISILEGKSMLFQFFHILVTTRRSHADKIPEQFHRRSLLIKGFNEESMKQFLDKQHVSLPSVGKKSNLSHLLQTPLFCAIYCSLHFDGGDPIELEDSYDLIKSLVENSVTNTSKKKTVDNEKEQLDEIGKFAFQMLDSWSLNFLKEFCRSSEVIKPSFDLSRVNLDFLIKKTITTRGVGGLQEEFSFPHQLLAEYLAARYFARSLTEGQLKQANASALINAFNNRFTNQPFVRFFLFELLFLYLEKKYGESVFDNFLNISELRFIWNMKSNTGIPTLDNVIDLNFNVWNRELVHHSRFILTLSKCRNLSSLNLHHCELPKNQVEQLVNFISNNCFHKLIKLDLSRNENVGSSTHLFHVLHKCPQLQLLDLDCCSMTQESLNILLSAFNSSRFQQLDKISLWGNKEIKVDDYFYNAVEKWPKISFVHLSKSVESDLREVGRKAKETLKQRHCQFLFD